MSKNTVLIKVVLSVSLVVALITGEIKCIIKAVRCNWEPIGKAEVIYTAAAVTGLGSIVGYIDIQDK
jgi:hypothetical protein